MSYIYLTAGTEIMNKANLWVDILLFWNRTYAIWVGG